MEVGVSWVYPQQLYKDNTIIMFEHDAFDGAFSRLYQESMALIEETAAYIDGDGKVASQNLSPEAATLYANEAMRMSSRLMEVASWLLLCRAARDGDMNEEIIKQEKAKICLNTPTIGEKSNHWHELPEEFCRLICVSIRLETRVRHMDNDMHIMAQNQTAQDNAVGQQMDKLKAAFNIA